MRAQQSRSHRWKPDFIDNGIELQKDWRFLMGYNEPGARLVVPYSSR